ncbi:MAG: mechanosensitive ion channel family protein [Treponema sp.]|nr:mechanosensitive ion channel family protein [Treponema sp.]MCL2237523.1 mechanosensitive ion channel family protein [Treponema sp.]
MGQQILNLWETHSDTIIEIAKNLAVAIIIIAFGIIFSKGAQKVILKTNPKHLPEHGVVRPLLMTLVKYGILIICVIMILNIFGINTASILAVLGVAGIAVGLALKDILGNLVSGIILLGMGSIRKGEFIEFTSVSGTVKEINLLTTILETMDGIYISAPNSSILGNPIKNFTRNGKRRMDISIGIAYSDSVDTAFNVMQGIIDAESRFLKDPAPQIILHSIEESKVKITLRAWTLIDNYWNINWEMNKNVKEKFEEAGLHLPLPQRVITNA